MKVINKTLILTLSNHCALYILVIAKLRDVDDQVLHGVTMLLGDAHIRNLIIFTNVLFEVTIFDVYGRRKKIVLIGAILLCTKHGIEHLLVVRINDFES